MVTGELPGLWDHAPWHALPALWDGRPVRWVRDDRHPIVIICPPPPPEPPCPRCGHSGRHTHWRGQVETGQMLVCDRCQTCGLDTVIDMDTDEAWLLDEPDYGPEGSRA